MSRWSKSLFSGLKLEIGIVALVLGTEPNFIWVVVHQEGLFGFGYQTENWLRKIVGLFCPFLGITSLNF